MVEDPIRKELEPQAIEALLRLFARIIRTEQDDPDHSGPEDVAETLAMQWVLEGAMKLSASDWRSLEDGWLTWR
jgi:hypothetical protein